jgi:sporulation protein YtfJ
MNDSKTSDVIRSSVEGIRSFADTDTIIGNAIQTPSGVTVIPVSKLTVGFAGGGLDFGKKVTSNQSFGSGSGSGVSLTPIAFLTVGKNAEINLIHINPSVEGGIDKISSIIEHSPEIIQKIKDTFS